MREIKKVFVILGSQKFQFNRLLEYVDKYIELNNEKIQVTAQIGQSTYRPKFFYFKNFYEREEFLKNIDEADIIITHGGTGAIVTSLKLKKKVIAIPRLAVYGEHVDNHQMEIIESFSKKGFIRMAMDNKEFVSELDQIDEFEPKTFISNKNLYLVNLKKIIE